MVNLQLTAEDARVLAEVLDADLRDLTYEIARTDHRDYRDGLKRKEAAIERALEGLGPRAGS